MSATDPEVLTLSAEQKQLAATLEGFTKLILGYGEECYEWMARIFAEIEVPGSKVSVRTCNGGGKTSRIATGAILWALAVFPRCKVVYTTASGRQLKYQLWPELTKRRGRFADWEWRDSTYSIRTPRGAQFVGFATDDAGRAEGWHGNKDPFYDLEHYSAGPLLFIVDEAKTVPDPIFEAIDRCTIARYLEVSSPGFAEGAFYRHHTTEAKFYRTFKVDAEMCPHVDHAGNAILIEKYGREHPLVQSKVFANFMDQAEDAVISLRTVEEAYANAPLYREGERRAHFDFAAGGDENVFALRDGNRLELVKCWRETDTMKACGEFIRLARQLGLKAHQCSGDNGGLGKPVIDRMHELGFTIRRVENQARANNPDDYANWSAETWFDGGAALGRHAFILPEDEALRMQLTGRKTKPNSAGKLALESKQDMKKRGVSSPDRADAVLELMRDAPRAMGIPLQGMTKAERFWSNPLQGTEERELDESILTGMNAGL